MRLKSSLSKRKRFDFEKRRGVTCYFICYVPYLFLDSYYSNNKVLEYWFLSEVKRQLGVIVVKVMSEYVYGVMSNTGDGDEFLWRLGVCLTEEDAAEQFAEYLGSGNWIDKVKVLKN